MSWFMGSSADGSARVTSRVSTAPARAESQELAAFGLLPLSPPCRFDSVFLRYVELEDRTAEDPWESVHLFLM
jgi:hypothetical protein